MKILVTGGSGFLGRAVVGRLVGEHDVTVLDLTSPPEAIADRVHFVEGSILDEDLVARLVAGKDVVMHFAAALGVRACQDDEGKVTRVNVEGTRNVVDAVRRAGSVRHLIFSSSSEVYGEGSGGRVFRETDEPRPRSAYGKSKVEGERMLRALAEQGRVATTAVRLFNAYGPGQREDFVVTAFCRAALAGEPLLVHGDGLQTRTFTFIEDIAEGIVSAMRARHSAAGSFEIYNLVSEETATIRTLAETTCMLAGRPVSVILRDFEDPEVGRSMKFEILRRVADNQKAREALGFVPRTPLVEGLRRSLRALAEPTQREHIPYTRPRWTEAEASALRDVLESGWWTGGPWVGRLEQGLVEQVGGGSGHAIAVANGTLALLAVLHQLRGDSERSLYIASSLDFAAGPACARLLGYEVALCDVDPRTLNMDPASLSAQLDAARDEYDQIVVNPVLFAGRADGLGQLAELSAAAGASFVEDACHALGLFESDERHWQPHPESAATVFSFHPTKNVATGEGGAIFVRDEARARALRAFRSHCMDREGTAVPEEAMTRGQRNPWYYEIARPGLNLRLSEFHAAVATVQLDRLHAGWKQRVEIARRYVEALRDGPVRMIEPASVERSALHLFPVVLPESGPDRHEVFARLRAADISPQVHYVPLHRQPAFASLSRVASASFPNLDELAPRLMSLPMFPDLRRSDQQRVITALLEATAS